MKMGMLEGMTTSEDLGFLKGLPGAGLILITLLNPEHSDWDQLILL
jgi:hypothetical protein